MTPGRPDRLLTRYEIERNIDTVKQRSVKSGNRLHLIRVKKRKRAIPGPRQMRSAARRRRRTIDVAYRTK